MRLRTSMPAVIAATILFFSCTKKDVIENVHPSANAKNGVGGQNTFYGPAVAMGHGTVRSFAVLDATQKPVHIGFEMTASSLDGLFDHHHGDNHGHEAFLVPLHQQAKAHSIFDHLVVDWNAHGHQPGPYLAPHFDFHFYMMKLADRLQIAANDPLGNVPVPADYLHPDYFQVPNSSEPQMGAHCVDVTSPELNGNPFTHTFIYGAYNGKVTFYEPMVTHDFLVNATAGTYNIKQPAKFSKGGYYPTKYSIYNSNGTRYVVLSEFVHRNAG